MKKLFPLHILLDYMKKDIYSEIKAALINVFTHTYLNERPRYIKKMQKVFPIYGIKDKESFKNAVLSRSGSKLGESRRKNYEYELKEMDASGLSKNAINDIFSCIE